MKIFLTFAFLAIMDMAAMPAAASNYFLDNGAVDTMFAQSQVVEINEPL